MEKTSYINYEDTIKNEITLDPTRPRSMTAM